MYCPFFWQSPIDGTAISDIHLHRLPSFLHGHLQCTFTSEDTKEKNGPAKCCFTAPTQTHWREQFLPPISIPMRPIFTRSMQSYGNPPTQTTESPPTIMDLDSGYRTPIKAVMHQHSNATWTQPTSALSFSHFFRLDMEKDGKKGRSCHWGFCGGLDWMDGSPLL